MINMADEFVFYDDVQYTKKDWRNRNLIKTKAGIKWLTVPCQGHQNLLICDVKINQINWQRKHWGTISNNYRKAKYYKLYKDLFKELYNYNWQWLSDLNQTFIKRISKEILRIETNFHDSREFALENDLKKEDRWIELLRQMSATDYILGPSARNYIDHEKEMKIRDNGINLIWMDYSDYPEYTQLFPPFDHHVSIIDLIFNEGPNAKNFMKSFT